MAAELYLGNLGTFLIIWSRATMNRARNATNETARLAMSRRGLGTANFGLNIELRNWAIEPTLIYGEKERESYSSRV